MKLISMLEFVLEQEKSIELDPNKSVSEYAQAMVNAHNSSARYAKFLSQPLTLGMFVPCDLEGKLLAEPKWSAPDGVKWDDYVNQYQQAKERVLFEGFEVNTRYCNDIPFDFVSKDEFYVFSKDPGKEFVINEHTKTIEDLIEFGTDIILTQSAIKQLEL